MESLLGDTVVLLFLSAAAVLLARQLGLPEVLGYLAAGLLLGPEVTGLLGDIEAFRFLAELGVILLMFTVGMEFSPARLWAARRHVFVAGGCEMLLVGGCAAAVGLMLGMSPLPALLVGGAVAMSSTAITLKQLRDLDRLHTQAARVAVGVLLFQDLATLPFLILAKSGPGLGQATLVWEVALKIATAVGLAALLIFLRPVLRRLLAWVGTYGAGEPFLLTALLSVLGTAFLAQIMGLSAPIGAFLAGMVIAESDFRHRFENDIGPFRDLFLGVFFVTVGLQLDLSAMLVAPGAVAIWLVVILPFKALIIMGLGRLLGEPPEVAGPAGAMLGHGGEFALLLLTVGMADGLLQPATAHPVLAAAGLSMAVAPLLIRWSGRVGGTASGVERHTAAHSNEPGQPE